MTLISVTLVAVIFVIGYLVGRLDTLLTTLRAQVNNAPQGFFAKTDGAQRGLRPAAIAIDESKIVTEIRTDTLNKTTDIQFGKQLVATDDINAAVNKLSALKRN